MLNQKTLVVEYKTKSQSKERVVSQKLKYKLKLYHANEKKKTEMLKKREKKLEAQKRNSMQAAQCLFQAFICNILLLL